MRQVTGSSIRSATRPVYERLPSHPVSSLVPENAQLRSELDDVSSLRMKQDYVVRLDKLKEAYGHNIEVLQEGAETMERFNCFSYAFGAWNEERFKALVIKRAQEKLAPLNSGFVKTLIDDGFIADVSEGSPAVGDVALYLKDGVLTHAGHVVDASSTEPIIQSKWGGNEVHRHPLWEVPLSYGHEVRFVRAPAVDELLDRLEAHYA